MSAIDKHLRKKARKGIRGCWGTVGQGKLITLNRVFRKGFTKKQIPEGGEGMGPTDKWTKSTSGRGKSKCQDFKWETCLAYHRESVEIQSKG